jgi:hypothetical protein
VAPSIVHLEWWSGGWTRKEARGRRSRESKTGVISTSTTSTIAPPQASAPAASTHHRHQDKQKAPGQATGTGSSIIGRVGKDAYFA